MKLFPSILALASAIIWGANVPTLSAQSNAPTPRQTFTSFVTNTPLRELKFKPIAPPASRPEAAEKTITPPPVEDLLPALVPDFKPAPSIDAEIVTAAKAPNAEAQPISPEITLPKKDNEELPSEDPAGKDLPVEDIEEKVASLPPNPRPLPDQPEPDAPPSEPAGEPIENATVPAENSAPDDKADSGPAVKQEPKAEAAITPEPELAGAAKQRKAVDTGGLLPFYISAADYLAARGNEKQTHLQLMYKVSLTGAKSELTSSMETRTVTIGPDFVATEHDGNTRILDFKTNRLLTLTQQNSDVIFSNISLYAGALKNVQTVNRATKNGDLSEIKLGPEMKLDSFWLEASLGWAARSSFEPLKVSREGGEVTTSFGDHIPLKASLTGPNIPSEDHMRALFAWWHHDLPIHPAILPKIGRPDKAPKTLQIFSRSPKFPNGLMAKWELVGSKTSKASFPLPETAKTPIEADQTTPLAFAIAQAARGNALSKRASLDDLRQDIHDNREAGRDFEAWLAAQMLANRLGGCAKDPALLCKDIASLENKAKPGSDLAKLPGIIRKARRPATRIEGFRELAPYIEDTIAPAFLVKIAGQARARIQSKDLDDPKLKALRADQLLEEALVKSPYDPVIYRTLGQVYAAQGNLAESWDMQDAMRKLPDVPESLSDPINWAERSLLVRAPGFFLQDIP